tara:strand:+ start:1972 stop:3675 length:1704 start_codon:yes stop_codon:yes gene_type:complete
MQYKIKIANRQYSEFTVYDNILLRPVELKLNPVNHKLFDQDVFEVTNEKVDIIHSTIRSVKNIPGVLVLEDNKTYGNHNGKPLYRCIPDDSRLPCFLIPHKHKIGFNKNFKNKYIVFKFQHWKDKHPRGSIIQVIGEIGILNNFYEYQLYCKSLYASIQNFNKATIKSLKYKTEEKYIEDMYKKYRPTKIETDGIFSIDPKKSTDFDDAFSINKTTICGKEVGYQLSIYISNVSFWLDRLELWDSFSDRISTIYLPDRKRPMLPTVLSDALCSLQEGRWRFAFTLNIYFDENGKIYDTEYTNTCIKVKKNYVYDEPDLLSSPDYQLLHEKVKLLNQHYNYYDKIESSHDVVAYLMILMNYHSAKEMVKRKIGIFRSMVMGPSSPYPDNLPKETLKFLKMWNSSGGMYCKFENYKSHDFLNFESYVHITSPIRRLVDLLNIIQLQKSLEITTMSEDAETFYNKWTSDKMLEYINVTMKNIRKVQNDCNLLKVCYEDKSLPDKEFDGYLFDKIKRNDGLYQYTVFIDKLKMVNRMVSRKDVGDKSIHKFKIHIFIDEERLKQKLRLELI